MNETGEGPDPVWLVAANVVAWRRSGVAGARLLPGTKSFKGGSKVYVARVHWGPGGDRLTVVGRERHTSRWIVIDTATRHLHSFRPKLVHTPRVLARLNELRHHGRGFGADEAVTVSATLEDYARRYRSEVSPHSPHPDHCLCHACLAGEAAMPPVPRIL
ncbi:hypothetical protein ACIGO8_12885 [Streptomyces sp. NPDC053493]|uniref:hypothetical protein n=1 Tax=Streptomyces sp. NPDC053493 TaxID=3365705 RepID=UPI0037D10A82